MRNGLMEPPGGAQPPEADAEAQAMQSDTMPGDAQPDPYFGGAQEASPEEQEQYESAMDTMWQMLYKGGKDSDTADKILDSLTEGGATAESIGKSAGILGSEIFAQIDHNIRENGGVFGESVQMEVAESIVEELLEIAETAGALPTDDQSIEQAVTIAMSELGSRHGKAMADQGLINPQAAQSLLHEMRGVASERLGIPSQQSAMSEGVQQAGPQMAPPQGGPQQGGLMNG